MLKKLLDHIVCPLFHCWGHKLEVKIYKCIRTSLSHFNYLLKSIIIIIIHFMPSVFLSQSEVSGRG